jgi:hypothetical protein
MRRGTEGGEYVERDGYICEMLRRHPASVV